MLQLFSLVARMALGIAVPAWVIRRDLKRLSPERRARAWNEATFWSAVVWFGPLAVLVHFARTRRSLAGFALGLAWAALSLAPAAALAWVGQS